MRRLRSHSHDRSHARLGVLGTILVALIVILALSSTAIPTVFGRQTYTAEFSEAGGLRPGDDVVVSGMSVGKVRSIQLNGAHVDVEFDISDDDVHLGSSTAASIVAQTALGKRALRLIVSGPDELEPGSTIPLDRTVAPFDVTQALAGLTQTIQKLDTGRLEQALTLSGEVLHDVSGEVSPMLTGIRRLSATIASRDSALARLLRHAANVTGLLARRDGNLQRIFADGSVLLHALNQRRDLLAQLIVNVRAVSGQVRGVIEDNEDQINPALTELDRVLRVLRRHEADIDHALTSAAPLLRELGEVVAALPGFSAYSPNLAVTDKVPDMRALLGGPQ